MLQHTPHQRKPQTPNRYEVEFFGKAGLVTHTSIVTEEEAKELLTSSKQEISLRAIT